MKDHVMRHPHSNTLTDLNRVLETVYRVAVHVDGDVGQCNDDELSSGMHCTAPGSEDHDFIKSHHLLISSHGDTCYTLQLHSTGALSHELTPVRTPT
ncbi:hypothetical protein M404DRAFT_473062 [Pisolithus tinctorius Marx 270]|uniref:Uncharacterized protein n=1 Tax=Pisolithus tinctorius Marx 270 TaxID=870435 RepID=A0A0C3JYS6_PISTI|nr:hypothetical protein M404DRAFT_473062 [Pisolithus tinctorius Marx 270]